MNRFVVQTSNLISKDATESRLVASISKLGDESELKATQFSESDSEYSDAAGESSDPIPKTQSEDFPYAGRQFQN